MKGRSSSRLREVRHSGRRPSGGAFTLIELLLSLSLLILLMVVLVSMVNQTSSLWQHTSGKIEEFREARNGFESITRRLSQATLNTYWDYNDPNAPTKYIRQSELRFISGPGLLNSVNQQIPNPTHALFFYAPLGFVRPTSATDSTAANYQGLDNLLNLWGYFVEYADDSAWRPGFMTSPARKRFRLMELMQPSHTMDLYSRENATGGNTGYVTPDWFQSAVSISATQPRPVQVLAENIIALVVLPKFTPADEKKGGFNDASLAPGYFYNSTGFNLGGTSKLNTASDPTLNPTNQLPPVVQVTMVAIDENSARRMTDQDNVALLGELQGLFSDPKSLLVDLTGQPKAPAQGLPLQTYLSNKHLNYRTFTSDVSIRAAKWSSNQTN
jgi:uncharacterized protein (TIGR02599 family)